MYYVQVTGLIFKIHLKYNLRGTCGFGRNGAMMHFYNIFGNRQPQTVAAIRLPGLVSTVKPVKDSGKIAVLCIWKIIGDVQTNLIAHSMQCYMDRTLFGTVFGSVVDQNRDQLPDGGFVSF